MDARISIPELADGAGDSPLLDAAGRIAEPLLVVDLDVPADGTPVERAVRAAAVCDRLLVGVRNGAVLDEGYQDLVNTLDLTLSPPAMARHHRQLAGTKDPDAGAAALVRAAADSPQAALVLKRVVRTTGLLDVGAALDVESLAYSTLLGGREFRRWLDHRGPRPLPPPAAQPVLVDRVGDQLHVTLNRPERRNAYGRELRDAFVSALLVAALDPSIDRVLLTGTGPSFCSGGDIDEFGAAPDLATAHFVRTRAGAAWLLHQLADRVEVHVHGSCVGAGIELPAFAGRVIADPDTTFRLPEVAMGLIPGAGGTVSIPRRIGRWRTLLPALSGQPLDAATAHAWGLVDEVGNRRRVTGHRQSRRPSRG